MPIWMVITAIVLPIAWLVAEFKAEKAFRITLGLLAIVVLNFVLFVVPREVRRFDKDYMKGSFEFMHSLIQSGHTGEVLRAIEAYQEAVKKDTAYSFYGSSALSQDLWRSYHQLNVYSNEYSQQMNTNSEPSGGGNAAPPRASP